MFKQWFFFTSRKMDDIWLKFFLFQSQRFEVISFWRWWMIPFSFDASCIICARTKDKIPAVPLPVSFPSYPGSTTKTGWRVRIFRAFLSTPPGSRTRWPWRPCPCGQQTRDDSLLLVNSCICFVCSFHKTTITATVFSALSLNEKCCALYFLSIISTSRGNV